MNLFSGVITALVTPFKGGRIDIKSFQRLMRFQLDHGIQGFVIAGTTGESPNLTGEERRELFDCAKSFVGGQVPVLVGTGSNSTAQTVLWTKEAEDWGADGALIVTPYYNKPPQRGLIEHYKAVANATSLPILLYNVPGRTGVEMSVETIEQLSQVKNIVGVKEATGNLSFLRELVARVHQDFSLISGDDGTCVEFMRLGGVGVISVLSHLIPKALVALCSRARKGEDVNHEFLNYAHLIELLFVEANPIPVKAALQMMGIIESDELRLPLVRMATPLRSQLHFALQNMGALS
jgi:4-hydroxy-tetrahydrodipicolinate synthase